MAKPLNSKKVSKPAKAQAAVVFPDVGSIYSFTSNDGFYGAIRVAKIVPANPEEQKKKRPWSGDSVAYVTTPYYDPSPPELTDLKLREMHRKTFGNWPALSHPVENWQAELPVGGDFTLLGVISPVAGDQSLVFGKGYWNADRLLDSLQRQRAHDEGVPAPPEAAKPAVMAAKSPLDEVRDLRSLLEAPLFAKWENHPRSTKFIAPARAIVRATVEQLQALGDDPPPTAAWETLKYFVEQFNRLHGSDPFVETSEGDDLTEVFSAMAKIMKLREDPIPLFEKWERF